MAEHFTLTWWLNTSVCQIPSEKNGVKIVSWYLSCEPLTPTVLTNPGGPAPPPVAVPPTNVSPPALLDGLSSHPLFNDSATGETSSDPAVFFLCFLTSFTWRQGLCKASCIHSLFCDDIYRLVPWPAGTLIFCGSTLFCDRSCVTCLKLFAILYLVF